MKYSKDYDDEEEAEKNLWMSYCDFHLGDYKKCLDEYEKVYDGNRDQKDIGLNIGVCMFMLGELWSLCANLEANHESHFRNV